MPSNKNSDDKKRSNTETARRIWLAGVGAYGRAFSEAQEALKDVTGKGSEIFDELVKKGEVIEKVVEVKGKSMMDKAPVPNFDLDERIQAMRSRLSRGDTGNDFEERLSAVEAKLDKIIQLLEPKKTAKKPAKKASAKRTTTVRTKKTTAKKAATKKTPVKKKPVKKKSATAKKTTSKK